MIIAQMGRSRVGRSGGRELQGKARAPPASMWSLPGGIRAIHPARDCSAVALLRADIDETSGIGIKYVPDASAGPGVAFRTDQADTGAIGG
jgi:hypothetical protein